MTQEIWKDIQDYETLYAISNFGRVKSYDVEVRSKGGKRTIKGRILKPLLVGHNYLGVNLAKNTIHKMHSVHRLVAQAFIPNNRNLPEVNHIDGNKKNNNVSNLEWTTHSQNMKHSQVVLGFNIPKKVLQIKNNKIIAVFNSAKEAEKETGICHIQIRRCCKKRKYYNTAGGYEWQYDNIRTTKGGDNE